MAPAGADGVRSQGGARKRKHGVETLTGRRLASRTGGSEAVAADGASTGAADAVVGESPAAGCSRLLSRHGSRRRKPSYGVR